MFDLSFEKVPPLENHLQIAKTHFVSQVYRLNSSSHPLTEHTDTVFNCFGLGRTVLDNSKHVSDRPEPLSEIQNSAFKQLESDNQTLSIRVDFTACQFEEGFVGDEES